MSTYENAHLKYQQRLVTLRLNMVSVTKFFMSLNNFNQLEVCCQESSHTAVHLRSLTEYVRQLYQENHINTRTFSYFVICFVCNVSMIAGYT